MKNLRLFFVLIACVVNNGLYSNVVDSSKVRLPVGKHIVLECSISNADKYKGNFLHKIIKGYNDENVEISIVISGKPGAINKEMNEALKTTPYYLWPELVAMEVYRNDVIDDIGEQTSNELVADLKQLLLEKDNEGKTPIDLLQEDTSVGAFLKAGLEQVLAEGIEWNKNQSTRKRALDVSRTIRNAALNQQYQPY